MVKLLECPVCHKHIHTLKGKAPCLENADLCIDVDGTVVKVDTVYDYLSSVKYVCPHCGYVDNMLNAFIRDISCECEHLTLTEIVYDDTQMDICEHCGLVVSSNPFGIDEYEPE